MTYYNLFIFLILVIAVLLILVIMVQNPKGGGLDSSFGGGGASLGGVQNTNKFLDKTTWTLAISLFALIIMSNFVAHTGNAPTESTIKIENLATPNADAEKTPAEETPAKTENTENK